eukprot:5702692-Pleurochrysis_carterae.AAC.1
MHFAQEPKGEKGEMGGTLVVRERLCLVDQLSAMLKNEKDSAGYQSEGQSERECVDDFERMNGRARQP